MKMRKLSLPLSKTDISGLKAGDICLLNGRLITGRDQVHLRFFETLKKGKKLPITLKKETIYYVGPTPAQPGHAVGSAGPTTSRRMDAFTPFLLSKGLFSAMIGKGNRSKEVAVSIKKNKAVYFMTIGGAGAFLSKRITSLKVIAYPELGPEAVHKFTVKDFPVIVAIDSRGKSIF
jgi:fumarate hydratase subunit beta